MNSAICDTQRVSWTDGGRERLVESALARTYMARCINSRSRQLPQF